MNTNPKQLMEAGLHLGHKKQRSHPKMNKYIYKYDNGIAIFDLFKTKVKLDEAVQFLTSAAKNNKTIIFVATKKTISGQIKEIAKQNNIPYLTNKWIGGFLTNFTTIKKNIDTVNDMIREKEEGDWDKLIKHERGKLEKKLNKMMIVYEGVLNLTKNPDILYVIDVKKEKNAVSEAFKTNIKIVAISDSNTNPELIDYPIPANDDALSSVEFITNVVVSALKITPPTKSK